MMLRTEPQKQTPVVLAVANSMLIHNSYPQFEVSSHPCVEISYDEEFVSGVILPQDVVQVPVKDLLYSNFSLQNWCIHTEDSGKLVVLDWEF